MQTKQCLTMYIITHTQNINQHTHKHTLNAYTQACAGTHIHTHILFGKHPGIHIHTHTQSIMHTERHIHTYTHSCTHTCIHAYIHAYTLARIQQRSAGHAHMHTCIQSPTQTYIGRYWICLRPTEAGRHAAWLANSHPPRQQRINTYTHIHTCTHTAIIRHKHIGMHTAIYTYSQAYIHTDSVRRTHTYIHTHKHAHINTATHTYRWPAKGNIRAAGWGMGGWGLLFRTDRYMHIRRGGEARTHTDGRAARSMAYINAGNTHRHTNGWQYCLDGWHAYLHTYI